MIKHGNVVVGETPSVESGRPSQTIKNGEPVRRNETPSDPGLRKLASVIDEANGVGPTIVNAPGVARIHFKE